MLRRSFAVSTLLLVACGTVASAGSGTNDAGTDASQNGASSSSGGSVTSSSSGGDPDGSSFEASSQGSSSSGGASSGGSSSGGSPDATIGSSSGGAPDATVGDDAASVPDSGPEASMADDAPTVADSAVSEDASIPDGSFSIPVAVIQHVLVPPTLMASNGTSLFWIDQQGLLWTAPTTGGSPTNIVSNAGVFLSASGTGLQFAVYTESVSANESEIEQAPSDGGAPTTELSLTGWLPGGGGPLAIVGSQAYWVENLGSGSNESAAVQTASIPGGAVHTLTTYDYQLGSVSIAVTPSLIFLSDTNLTLSTMPLSGGTPTAVPNFTLDCQSLLASGDSVFCASSPLVLVAPNGTTTRIALETNNVASMALDSSNLYWVNDAPSGSIMAAPKQGGANYVIAYDANPTAVAVDDTAVYWGDTAGNIQRAMKQ